VTLRVAVVGCGLIGHKRAAALGPGDELVASFDVAPEAARALAAEHGGRAAASLEELLAAAPDVVVVAATHDRLAELSIAALEAGAHVLVEKPAGIGSAQVAAVAAAAERAGRLVKVGFNHRFHPGIASAVTEARCGRHGEVMHVRARYGHGGRPGYDREWRADPARSGGGELIDQGMHLLDLYHWLLGPLPLHSALLRTEFWDAPVEDNAVVVLGDGAAGPWGLMHVSWTEWKNLFSLEIYCRTAKLQVDGLVRSYGSQRLTTYLMAPELGPPAVEIVEYPAEDGSWDAEWRHFRAAVTGEQPPTLLGDLESAAYAWSCVEAAYEQARACR
jgi:predicted dehydrogenase